MTNSLKFLENLVLQMSGIHLKESFIQLWGILTRYPEAEWIFSPESIMPPRPIERSSRAKGA